MTTVEDVNQAKGDLEFSWNLDLAAGAAGQSAAIALATVTSGITKRLIATRVRIACLVACNMNVWQERGNAAATFSNPTTLPSSSSSRRAGSSAAPSAVAKICTNFNACNGKVVARRLSVASGDQFEWEGYYSLDANNCRLIAACEAIGTNAMTATFDWYEETI